ncbi:MAG: flagellar basal body P-ring formation chaperone FlgA [Sulfurimicrobium sp.]
MPVRLFYLCLLLVYAFPTLADGQWQSLEAIQSGATQFALQQTTAQPGSVTVTAATLDPRLRLPACPALEFFVPAGSRLWGNSNIGVRCPAPSAWTVYVPVTIKITADIVFAARPLQSGQKLSEADILIKNDDLTQFASGVITDPRQVLGKIVSLGVAAGYPLRVDMLRAPNVIQQGQSVKIVARGAGFQVNAEGKALNNAAEGQIVSIRTPSGQVIKGTAREGGVVEVPF